MRLEEITAEVRPRSNWEAVDLGLLLVRRHWRPVWGAWLALTLPLAVLLVVLLPDLPWLAMAIFWWLKPVYDRLVLHVLSQALFGPPPTVAESLRALPGVLWRSGILLALTLYRLDPSRSFKLPVWQLEGLSGAHRRARQRVVKARSRGTAQWLTLACMHAEWVLTIGGFALLLMVLPQGIEVDWQGFFRGLVGKESGGRFEHLGNLFAYLAIGLVEPFYVGGGFGLYLNRRVHLEGWDLELAFRRLAQRLAGAARPAAVALLLGTLLLSAAPTPAPAAEPPADPQALIAEVLADEAFEHQRTITQWRYTGERRQREERDLSSLEKAGKLVARLYEGLLWLGGALLLGWIALNYRRWMAALGGPSAAAAADPGTLVLGLDIRPESLPADIPEAALARWREGDAAASLSLLYRGALAELVHRRGLELPRGATEGDCLRRARAAAPESGDYFGELTRAWQRAAYAQRPPPPERIEALCRAWGGHFGGAPTVAAA